MLVTSLFVFLADIGCFLIFPLCFMSQILCFMLLTHYFLRQILHAFLQRSKWFFKFCLWDIACFFFIAAMRSPMQLRIKLSIINYQRFITY